MVASLQKERGAYMSWHKVFLSVDQILARVQFQLQDQFEVLFMIAGRPKDMALFSGPMTDDGVALYFSPGAAKYAQGLIEQYNGSKCEKPTGPDIALEVGHHASIKRLL